ncbi:MAG: DsbA family protein, partial [Solirubrobacteraceae bacterium]
LEVLPTLIPKYVRTGKLKIEYHSMQTATHEQETFHAQQIAALAAGKQSLAWYYIELFYHEQGQEGSGYVTESYLQSLAQQVPRLNLPNWSAARNDSAFPEQLTRDAQTVNQEGFTGTPSFLLGKSGTKLAQFKPETFSEPSPYETAINKLH